LLPSFSNRLIRTASKIPGKFIKTAQDSEVDEVHGLEIGAEGYMKKPIGPKVMVAQIKALQHLIKTIATQASASAAVAEDDGDEVEFEITRRMVEKDVQPTRLLTMQ
jgi:DNA-binding response OmpR family regulator